MTITPKSYPLRGTNNQLLTVSLFYEPWVSSNPQFQAAGVKPIFTINSHPDYVSARLTFLATRDPTGVAWAEMWLEGVNHLNRLLQAPWFAEAFEVWQGEAEQLLQAEALSKVREIAEGTSPAAFQAAKFLAKKEWKGGAGRGRPSKAEVNEALKREMAIAGVHADDLQRISKTPELKVVR